MATALKSFTFEELYRQLRSLPNGMRGEILDGSLITSPRPAVPHASGATQMLTEVNYRFGKKPGGGDTPGGWYFLLEPELHLTTGDMVHVVSPDIAGWRRETLSILPRAAWIDVRPDWVCEILSPATARYDKRQKARIYHEAGVTWRWLVDPNSCTVDAYRREGAFWTLIGSWGADEKAKIEPFDAVELDLSIWWGDVEPI